MDDLRPSFAAARASLNLSLPISGVNQDGIQQGFVLKKRRKKMQGPIRDQIYLPNAAIATAPGRKDIHIDSNNATFHLKCLSTEDFTQWMAAFRKFSAMPPESRRSASIRISSRQNTVKLSKSAAIAEEMGLTLAELEQALNVLRDDKIKRKVSSSSKDKTKEGVFGLFKKGAVGPAQYIKLTAKHHVGHHSEHAEGSKPERPSSVIDPSYQRIHMALESLKVQHGTLVKSLHSISALALESTPLSAHPSAQASPLPSTVEEEEHPLDTSSDILSMSFTRRSNRASVATTVTDSVNEWFDASDGEGVQEFVLDDQSSPENGEGPSRIITEDSRSSLDSGRSSIDTDIDPEGAESQTGGQDADADPSRSVEVTRRTYLPTPVVGDEGSLFAVLKKNVGKDLSTIAFPVTFNEPLTLLQRAAEELEYFDLLNQAAAVSDPVERLHFVSAFAVSGYAHTRHRTGRKGLYVQSLSQCVMAYPRMKFIGEKVRHQPVEMAYHAEGENWEFNATSAGKTKFWGKSLEIIPLGTSHVTIGDDHYQWKKPSSFMRNLMVGTKYLEHVGVMTVENSNDRHRCVLEFKQSGYWGSSNVVSGQVYDASGTVISRLEGKWDEHLSQAVDSSHFTLLWRAHPWPKQTHDYYGFTSFGMTLNEITPDIVGKLPVTDSRYRPDVRALEEGGLDKAEAEKIRVEEMQRARRREGKETQPRWFRLEGGEWTYAGGYWEARAKGWKGTNITPFW
ncbi:hypothetical protein D9757_006329 [Collybiopsis confluens]|uniref:PH domain-containing protein n=1 Tax=Collybiopsis confluens TaxID=2823264 RepID=A0A8H5HGM1_9AGAR|nr:hypothetical protein D9757_006329 [Collybiopsis confluens]